MSEFIQRTCSRLLPRDNTWEESRPLADFRDEPTYVLLGNPGMGKTTAFEMECAALGENARLLSARNFLSLDLTARRAEWEGKILFIDGLDEIRAGQTNKITPFEELRRRLDTLGRPRFRLSCRAADWLGSNDLKHLSDVSPAGGVTVLNLEPLGDADIADILSSHYAVSDATAFIDSARERGVGELLSNPQSLLMVAQSVAAGSDWPSSRMQVFETSSSQLAREHNEEHVLRAGATGIEDILEAAGHLCALQLLAGCSGFALNRLMGDPDYLPIEECTYSNLELLQSALSTKLFSGKGDLRSPVHRHTAEDIGARYLASVIGSGLPAARVLSLMVGEDGVVVSELRGLSAWLATLSKPARNILIDIDPGGVGQYGDISSLARTERISLLKSLRAQIRRVGNFWQAAPAFEKLASEDMVPAIDEVLADSDRSDIHQDFIYFLLVVASRSGGLGVLTERLLNIVRDENWRIANRRAALGAYIRNVKDETEKISQLRYLLEELRTGALSDTDGELLDVLLTELYPAELHPSEVWDSLLEDDDASPSFNRIKLLRDILGKITDQQATDLLRELSTRLERAPELTLGRQMEDFSFELLYRGLRYGGTKVDRSTLYDWLRVGAYSWSNRQSHTFVENIRAWLEEHPQIQQGIILEGMLRSEKKGNEFIAVGTALDRLVGSSLSPDFGRWCVEESVALAESMPRTSKALLGLAVRKCRSRQDYEGPTLEEIKASVASSSALLSELERMLSPIPISPRQLEIERRDKEFRERMERKEREWLEYVRSNRAALKENRAVPALLHEIAGAYFGDFVIGDNKAGIKGLEGCLSSDMELVEAALAGLRATINRPDMPDAEEIIGLHLDSRLHYLCLPFLAGIVEFCESADSSLSQLSEKQIRIAIACYYCAAPSHENPNCYRQIVEERPDIVSDVLVRLATAGLRSGKESIRGLWELAMDEAHAEVASLSALPILRSFPTRCKDKQLYLLHWLLLAAIRNVVPDSLYVLIARKVALKSMNVSQRALWLAAGLVTSPKAYTDQIESFVANSERRTRHVARFFSERWADHRFDSVTAGVLVRLIGKWYGPELAYPDGLVTLPAEASMLVTGLINQISSSPSVEAKTVLEELCIDDQLGKWRAYLSRARDNQRVIYRDASYEHPSPNQIENTLDGGVPTNAGDLAALLSDELNELTRYIPDDSSNPWRLFWNEDKGKPNVPKYENSCRDALINLLRPRLLDEIGLQPEAQFVHGNRADIRVNYGGFSVPIEIKTNGHRELWSAMERQLIKKYTREPGTGGFGIYLVLWFGVKYTQAPLDGQRPATPQELQFLLEDTLTMEQKRRILVCVIDVSGT